MKDKVKKILGFFCLFVLVLLGVLLVFTVKWLLKTWGLLTIDEIVYHMKSSLDGTNPDMIRQYITGYGLKALLIVVLLFAGLIGIAFKKPQWEKRYILILVAVGVLGLGYAFFEFNANFGAISYLKNELFGSSEDFIAEHYVDPGTVDVSFGDTKQNLIYIYMESTEMTFSNQANGGAFEENVIPELTDLALQNDCFAGDSGTLNGGVSLPGSTWTMGALFAQSSGLPLKIPLYGNLMKRMDTFFPTTITLGDILSDNGYYQMFMCGSDATFGGRDKYYSSHGYDEIYDLNSAISEGKIPADYNVFWGFEDEKLFEYAKEKSTAMAAQDQPFNLTLLTVDTHFEDGYVCELCGDEFGGNQYANVFACSSRQVSEFVQWVQQQDFGKNTTIVICGDHPTMDTDFCNDVDSSYQRRTYTTIINSAAEVEDASMVRSYSTMDLFPTTLAAMGAKIDGNKLGLGVNLYSTETTLLEEYGEPVLTQKLNQNSAIVSEMSGISISEETMDRLKRRCYINVSEAESGNLYLDLKKVWSTFDIEAVDKIEFKVTKTDPDTGKTKEYNYEANIAQRANNPTKFDVTYETDIAFSELSNCSISAYIWVEGYEDYWICDYVPE